jgi:predicted protein tyrosine phosphatase
MPHIIVSSLERLPDTVDTHNASHVLTLINARTPVTRPATIAEKNHLFLGFDDIVTPLEDMTPPAEAHIHAILEFAEGWDRSAPMVIHCFAGISRSTAGAYICALALNPALDERALALELRRRAPSATPNILLVQHADSVLKRGGRMVKAIKAIGRGEDAFSGTPFVLPLEI